MLSSTSHPKTPAFQVKTLLVWQVVRLKPLMVVPVRLVVEAKVANKLVVVALDDVEFRAVKFWRVDEPLTLRFANVPRPVDVKSPPLAAV